MRPAATAATAAARSWQHRDELDPAPRTWPIEEGLSQRVQLRWPRVYEWPAAEKWVGGLRRSLAAELPLRIADIPQPYEGVVLIEFELDGVGHEVAIDYFDQARLLDEVVARCPLVFKMQFDVDGYAHPNVVPGGYVPGRRYLHRYLAGFRHLRDSRTLRPQVYGRFGLAYATEIRRSAIELLRAQRSFHYEGSLAIRPYAGYLREAALSQVCLDLPGNGDMCHRLVEYLALGCCVVRPQPRTRLPVELNDGVNVRFVSDLETGLVSACEELVNDPARSMRMGLAARDYFDLYLSADQLAGYYIDRCVTRLCR